MKILLTTIATLAICGLAHAGDAAAGKAAALTCVACHGDKGISNNNLYPNLAGQKDAYTVKQLKAFKDGSRKDPTMNAMAKPLSDKQMEDIAAYFASLK
jgi:cytochrome c553